MIQLDDQILEYIEDQRNNGLGQWQVAENRK